ENISDVCDRPEKSLHQRPEWEQVLFLISRIDDPRLRLVLSDWAAGFTGTESARRHGLSDCMVSRLRQQGVTYLRRKLDSEERQ
ncbi:MAG: hypothetical protein AB7O38_29940, partial [Pirellulaceae bacterium]